MIIFSIIGTLIGAGFASGQEMYLFFYKYGVYGIFGLVLCSILIGIIIYKTFIILLENKKIAKYQDFLNTIYVRKEKNTNKYENKNKNKYLNLSYCFKIIVNTFLIGTFFIMISGFGAYFEQEFNINKIIGATILAILSYFILIKDIEGVTKVNSIIVPILIATIIIIGIKSTYKINIENITKLTNKNQITWLFQSIIYCSYNMILLIPVLVELKKYIKSKKQIIVISIFSSLIVFLLSLSIFLILGKVNIDFNTIQMPVIYVIDKVYPRYKNIYGITILVSIFSTTISIGISFLKNIAKNKKSFPQIAGIMCISGVLISNIGFSNLVKIIFPAFGYLGIFEIIYILKFKNKKEKR